MQIKRPHSSSSLFPLRLTPMDVQYLLLHSPAYWFTDFQTMVNKIIPSSSTESDISWLGKQTLRHVSRLLGSHRDTVNWVSLLTSRKSLIFTGDQSGFDDMVSRGPLYDDFLYEYIENSYHCQEK